MVFESRMSAATGTYVYGVIAGAQRRSNRRRKGGVPGAGPVRLLSFDGDLAAAVADAPLRVYGEGALAAKLSDLEWVSRAAVAHEAVLESFADAAAVVPMKLFTLFTSDDRAVAHLRSERRRIEATVKRVANHQEWGVRVVLPPAAAAARPRGTRPSAESGAQFLTRKKADRDRRVELANRAAGAVDGLFDRLTSSASAAMRRAPADASGGRGSLLLDAAFLVARTRAKTFGAAVAREARTLGRAGYAVTMSGPWPPYSFVQE